MNNSQTNTSANNDAIDSTCKVESSIPVTESTFKTYMIVGATVVAAAAAIAGAVFYMSKANTEA